VPKDLLDSLAFAVSRGSQWEFAKLQLAQSYERRRLLDSAVAEYRDLPATRRSSRHRIACSHAR